MPAFRSAGTLTVARGAHQLPALRASYGAYERLGLAEHYQFLNPEEVAERIRITDIRGGLYTPDGASLHPGRLVRGLARAVESFGGVIYEQGPKLQTFYGGSNARLLTDAGEIRARKAIVLAGEAYLSQLPKLHRALLPVYSLICLTEPLTSSQWDQIGWSEGENLSSTRNTVVYLTKTHDGRILFGSRGAPYTFGSRISDQQDRHLETQALIQSSLLQWFPMLEGIRFTPWLGWSGWYAHGLDSRRALQSSNTYRLRGAAIPARECLPVTLPDRCWLA